MRSDAAGALDPSRVGARRIETAPALIGLVAAASLAVFVAWPIAAVLVHGLRDSARSAGETAVLALLRDSLGVAAASAVLTVALGAVLAYAVTRAGTPGRRLVSPAIRLPMIVPPFFASLALLLLFGEGGPLARVGVRLGIYGFRGIVIAQVFTFLPTAFLVMAGALRAADGALEEAAESLGSSGLGTLRRVTAVLARPGLASSLLVVFVLSLSDFANPFLIGGDFRVLATEIYARAVGAGNPGGASVLGVALLAPCLLAWVLNTWWLGAAPVPFRWESDDGTGRRMTPGSRRLLVGIAAGTALGLVGLHGGVGLASVVRLSGGGWGVSLRHYAVVLGPAGVWPLLDSLWLAAVAAGLGTALALGIAYVVARHRVPGAAVIRAGALLPAALPGTVLGLGYLLAFSESPLRLAGTTWILVASVVFWKLPLGVLTAVDGLTGVDPALEEAAESLGAGPFRIFARVTLPYLVALGVLTFIDFLIDGIVTVGALIVLAYPGFVPASVAILTGAEQGELGRASALGTVLFALTLGAALVRRRVAGDRAARSAP